MPHCHPSTLPHCHPSTLFTFDVTYVDCLEYVIEGEIERSFSSCVESKRKEFNKMKTKVKNPMFKPITIVIESPQELHDICHACYMCEWALHPTAQKVYEFLANYTQIYPYESNPGADNESL